MRVLCGLAFFIMAANCAIARDASSDEKEILRVEAALCAAFQNGEVKTLRENMDSQFTQVSSRGEVTDLDQNIGEVSKRDPYYDEFRNHDQKVRLYGDAAIIIGTTTTKGKSGGEPFDLDFKYTDTYVYRGGHWLLAASHASRLKK